jgi:hypothetical protein
MAFDVMSCIVVPCAVALQLPHLVEAHRAMRRSTPGAKQMPTMERLAVSLSLPSITSCSRLLCTSTIPKQESLSSPGRHSLCSTSSMPPFQQHSMTLRHKFGNIWRSQLMDCG